MEEKYKICSGWDLKSARPSVCKMQNYVWIPNPKQKKKWIKGETQGSGKQDIFLIQLSPAQWMGKTRQRGLDKGKEFKWDTCISDSYNLFC